MHFWGQEELGAGRGARPDLSSRDLSQLFPAPGRASLGTFLSSTLYPDFYVEKARKYSCHILVRSKTALQHRPVQPGLCCSCSISFGSREGFNAGGHFFTDTSKPGRHCWNSTLLSVCNDLKTPGFSGVLLLLLWITHQMVSIKILQMMNSA